MQTSGQFGVPPPEVPPQYNPVNNNMNNSSNSSNRATSTPGSNQTLVFNLSNHDQEHGSLSPSSAFNNNPHSAHSQPANASPGLLSKAGLRDNADSELLQEARHPHYDFSHFLHSQAASSPETAQQQQLLQQRQGNSESGVPPANTNMQSHAPVHPTMPTSHVQAYTSTTTHGHMAAPVLAPSTEAPDQENGEAQKQAQAMQLHHHHRQLSLGLDEAATLPASNTKNTERQVMNADPMSLGDIDQADEGAGAGNRWPRQETLALLTIRADIDAAFRDTSVKRPLWDEVSRKLGELGYERSAKKCKEKFENVNKYYKRTKEGKVGRQDGKNYRFFTQLEALSTNTNSTTTTVTPSSTVPTHTINSITSSTPPSSTNMHTTTSNHVNKLQAGAASAEASFLQGCVLLGNPAQPPAETRIFVTSAVAQPASQQLHGTDSTAHRPPHLDGNMGAALHNSSQSSSGDDDEDEDDDDYEGNDVTDQDDGDYQNLKPHPDAPHAPSHTLPPSAADESRKRKRKSSTSMMAFFEGLLNKVIQKQEQVQQKFLQAMEKRESDRMIREEAWRRQEMARLSKDHEIRAQERSSAAARDAALIAFLQKITGQTIDLPTVATSTSAPIAAQPVQSAPPLLYQENVLQRYEDHDASDPSSKRWLKPEVLHLIELHSSLQSKFTEVGPKGPLWEEIAVGMAKKGYPNRTAKRCKEKWENINKYYKRAKESSKKRPENAKTCPYFHELDALYRKGSGSSSQLLPYKPSIEHAQEENVSRQPSASNREGDLDRASSLQMQPTSTPTEHAVVSDASNASATDASNNSSSHVGDVVRNGSTTTGNMAQSVGSMQLSTDAFCGLNASLTRADNMPRSGFPADLGLSIQQQSSPLDIYQHKPVSQAEFRTLSSAGGEHMERVITQSQMQRDKMKESKPSLAALPNASSFLANMLQKLSSSNTSANNNGQDQ